jgi:mono/diheme cytochrome c family protein
MRRTQALTSLGVVLTGGLLLSGAAFLRAAPTPAETTAPAAAAESTLPAGQYPFWRMSRMYCVQCHVGPKAAAGLNMQPLDLDNLDKHGLVWEKLIKKLKNREMPPPGFARPDDATYQLAIQSIEAGRDIAVMSRPNPGRPTLHRINRAEYANVMRDLLGLDVDVSDLLPTDDAGYGFDNIGDVLTVSPSLLERYLLAAGKIARQAVGDPTMPPAYQTYSISHALHQDDRMSAAMPIGSRGGTAVDHFFPVDGEYEISLGLQKGRAEQLLGNERERKLDLRLDDQRLELFTLAAAARRRVNNDDPIPESPESKLHVRLPVTAGTHNIVATFLKDTVVQEGIIFKPRDGNVDAHFEGVGSISVAGPFNAKGPGATPSREKIFVCHPAAAAEEDGCAEKIITNLAKHAYRRPNVSDSVPQLMALYQQGKETGGFESGIRLALQKILVSPEFLFRVELAPAGAAPGTVYQISDVELASRLSFFLWSSIPDDELLAVAERGELRDSAMLDKQVRRMLADPRSDSLIKNFVGQWLFLRNIPNIQPDVTIFTYFDDNLREAMGKETEMVVTTSMREDSSIIDLLRTNYTYVNQRLAEHYGIPGIYGNEFRRISVTDPNRMGLLGHASISAVTAYPNRTAPTIRGKWVLEQLFGSPPPPPPPNVPTLKEDDSRKVLTMRERMEEHRVAPQCAVCHKIMDPIGFALENFDGLGKWRDAYNEASEGAIDSSGVLPDGTPFNGPAGLREILLTKKRDVYVENFTERLLTYALGRGVEEYDRPIIRRIKRQSAQDDYRWSSIILNIVKSLPFQLSQTRGA